MKMSPKGSAHTLLRLENGLAPLEDDGFSSPPRVESTIVSRETATHRAFARSRKEDFVYVPTSHYFYMLDDHCQWDREAQSALLVVVGQPGDGKSALLANWAEQRRRSIKGDRELIYEHYCGCSYDSVKLALFLFRFMNQLKTTYSLRDFELPHEHEEEKLKFSFSRCLKAAVGKSEHTAGQAFKRIILVLDGIDCVRSEDGGDSLSWLPNTFPVGVRIIVSTTQTLHQPLRSCQDFVRQQPVYDNDGDLVYDAALPSQANESHAIRELRRRNAIFMLAEPLDEISCMNILEMYECKFSRELTPDEKQLIVAGHGSSSPLYVRLLLNGLELFETSESDQRRQWLEETGASNELNTVYELLMKQWNTILLKDLFAELHERTKLLKTAASNPRALLVMKDQSAAEVKGGKRRPVPSGVPNCIDKSSVFVKTNAPADPTNHGSIESIQTMIEQRALLVRHTLSLIAVCRYGLSENDFVRLLGDSVPQSVCQQLLTLLKPHLMTIRRYDCGSASRFHHSPMQSTAMATAHLSKGKSNQESDGEAVVLYDFSHNYLRLLTRYGFLHDDQLRACYYRELAVYFEAMEVCQRRVDELPVQLERCSMWSVLQSALVSMRMFQLWWSERNRQEYLFYWRVLSSNYTMHDPVDDFIRSLDEYITQEMPSAEQLLSIVLTITDFLRAWQKFVEPRVVNLVLNRPKPPQLQEFLSSLGSFSMSSLTESEADRVKKEIDALIIHQDDGCYVRRWIWTQFPLIGTAFESRVFRSVVSSRNASNSDSSNASTKVSAGPAGLSKHGDQSPQLSSKKGTGTKNMPQISEGVALPKEMDKLKKTVVLTKRRLPHKALSTPGPESADTEMGAFEFLSAEMSEESLESQLMELRMKYDKLKFAAREQNEALKVLESRVTDAKKEVNAAGRNATHIDDLLENIRKVTEEANLGRQRSEYYKLILRYCELNPARDPNTIETAEASVAKLKREIVEMQQKTHVISYEKRLASLDVPKLVQVTQDKAFIHQEALSRLRWRQELDRRFYYASMSAKASGQSALRSTPSVSPQKKTTLQSGDAMNRATERDDAIHPDSNFLRAKDKLIHMKETSLARQKNAENLQLYVGSAYKDDGILGALRQVGINKPEEAVLCWQNQLDHAVQLQEEEEQAEQRVLEYREKLEHLQTQFVNLKLSGSFSGKVEGLVEDDAADLDGDGDAAAACKASVNVKMLEKQLAEANAAKQKKKERVARMRSLQERLQLGLLHIAHLLGMTATKQPNAVELADSIEKVVRIVLGDEAHLQAAPSPTFRHKNSTRIMTLTGQLGDSTNLRPDTRSDVDKMRYNIRVSRTEKRQMNPYVDTEVNDDEQEGDFDDDADAGDSTDHSDNEGLNCSGFSVTCDVHDDSDTVKKRRDIKHRAKVEIEKKNAVQKKLKD